jgi:hypothetical protein
LVVTPSLCTCCIIGSFDTDDTPQHRKWNQILLLLSEFTPVDDDARLLSGASRASSRRNPLLAASGRGTGDLRH